MFASGTADDATPLDKTHSLIEALCKRAAYNDRYAMWVLENTRAKPQPITTDASSHMSMA
jgi:hypothetical protein